MGGDDDDDDDGGYTSFNDAERRPPGSVFAAPPSYDYPIPIYLHSSLGKGGKAAIAKKIKEAGGDPTSDEDKAEVIICRDDHPAFRQLENKYDHHRYVWVEGPSWVDHCIRVRRYEHILRGRRPRIKKGYKGRRRNDFSPHEDALLARYIALRVPYKDTGGRAGNELYKQLVERTDLYPWAERHTWQSWRERYRKNQETFDSSIQRFVDKDPDRPKPGGKGQYVIPYNRSGGGGQSTHIDSRQDVEADDDDLTLDESQDTDKDDTMMSRRIPHKRPIPTHDPNEQLRPRKTARVEREEEDVRLSHD